MTSPRISSLLDELDQQRDAFVTAVGDQEARATTVPVIGNWDARDLVVHAAFWSHHGADARSSSGRQPAICRRCIGRSRGGKHAAPGPRRA